MTYTPLQLDTVLRQAVPRGNVLTAPAQLAGYDTDGLGYKTFRPDAIAIPHDADEMVRLMQVARSINLPFCIRGAGTSLSGGPVAAQGGVIVHTSRLRNIRTISKEGLWCEVECGVTLNQLDEALAPFGLFYPPDPSSGPVCTLGGNVAMNAGGAHCFRYGVTSNYVLGVEAILLDGTVHRFGGPAGGRGPWREDWKRLMVGSEGTLGAFTRFWLRVLPRPEKAWTFRATYTDLISAERAIHRLVEHSAYPVAIELMDPRCVAMVENSPMAVGLPKDNFMLLTEIDGPVDLVNSRVESIAQVLREAGSADVVFSDDEEQRKKLWKARKVAGGLMGQMSADFVVQDAVIPKVALAELLQLVYDEADAAGLRAVNVFHAGDGNLHPNFLFDSRVPGELERVEHISKRLMQRVIEVGGTLSGEHGIGNDKAAYMPLVFGERTMRLQMAVPQIFNSQHQLNPLKVFEGRRFVNGSASSGADTGERSDVGRNGEGRALLREAVAQKPGTDPRCFTHFIDPIDGIVCVSADTTAGQLREMIRQHQFRFPLLIDDNASLREQVDSTGYAPASSRFGPFCDNIVGMNWRLPNGDIVRIGERVVKTTTGYDLFRFLLSTGKRFGEPLDYVLRLRNDCEKTSLVKLSGKYEELAVSVAVILQSCWMHWFDSIDLIIEGKVCSVRIAVNAPESEMPLMEGFLKGLAAANSLGFHIEPIEAIPCDGCPDFVLKTTPDRVMNIARQVAKEHNVRCISLCYPGVVHGYILPDSNRTQVCEAILRKWKDELAAIGGDASSRHVEPAIPNDVEKKWISILEREFNVESSLHLT